MRENPQNRETEKTKRHKRTSINPMFDMNVRKLQQSWPILGGNTTY